MMRWEYCIVGPIQDIFRESNNVGYYPYLTFLNESGFKTEAISWNQGLSENLGIARVIARLGNEGWEMVGCGNTGENDPGRHLLYFKRSKQ